MESHLLNILRHPNDYKQKANKTKNQDLPTDKSDYDPSSSTIGQTTETIMMVKLYPEYNKFTMTTRDTRMEHKSKGSNHTKENYRLGTCLRFRDWRYLTRRRSRLNKIVIIKNHKPL